MLRKTFSCTIAFVILSCAVSAVAAAQNSQASNKGGHEYEVDLLLKKLASSNECSGVKFGMKLKSLARESDLQTLVASFRLGGTDTKQVFLSETFGKLKSRKAGDALTFEIKHGTMVSKQAAITALGKLGSDWPVGTLVGLLRNAAELEIRKRAASALGAIGSSRAIYGLETTLGGVDEKSGVHKAIKTALSNAKGEIDPNRKDTKFPEGRRVKLWYRGTQYLFYQPARVRSVLDSQAMKKPWLLVCVHDEHMQTESIFELCWRAGRRRKMAVIVPYFDHMRFPEYGSLNIRGERADKHLLELIDHVAKHADIWGREIYMYGFRMGGDFVERFVMSYPDRIARAVFDANNYTSFDERKCYPEGIGKNPLAPDIDIDIKDFLKADAAIILRKDARDLKEAEEFVKSIRNWSSTYGTASRLGIRVVDVTQQDWQVAEEFLFRSP